MKNTTSIKKQNAINTKNLSEESYFISILQEAFSCRLLNETDVENIQMQCIKFLAYKSERYNFGESSSIRVETAESIMKSNLYTIGLYLKSLPDADCAASELKTADIPAMYEKGRKLINIKLHSAEHIYSLVQKNRITTTNYTYNATLSDDGIGSFFKLYNADYEAHECAASIDYQLCNSVTNFVGVEFIQKYLENLYLENEFCRNFDAEKIHNLLCGYDEGHTDLLINIFEQVLTDAIGCALANRSVVKLYITKDEVEGLQIELSKDMEHSLSLRISKAAEKVFEELNITDTALRVYIEKSVSKITETIAQAVKTNTLVKVFVTQVNLDSKPKIEFLSAAKMDDEDYRKFINELLECRYLSDKLELIKESIKSLDDFEDLLFDAELREGEVALVFSILGDIELAALIKRHPFKPDIQAVDLSENELMLRLYLKNYIDKLPHESQKQILEMVSQLIVE